MTLRDTIEALPDDAMVPVRWVRELLATEPGPVAEVRNPATSSEVVDLTVSQVSAHLGKAPSTVRTWLLRGELPGAYRMHGREWRIPLSAIQAMQRAEAKRHREAVSPAAVEGTTDLSTWRRHVPKTRPA